MWVGVFRGRFLSFGGNGEVLFLGLGVDVSYGRCFGGVFSWALFLVLFGIIHEFVWLWLVVFTGLVHLGKGLYAVCGKLFR